MIAETLVLVHVLFTHFSEDATTEGEEKSVIDDFLFLPYLVRAKSNFSLGDKDDLYSLKRRINLMRQNFWNGRFFSISLCILTLQNQIKTNKKIENIHTGRLLFLAVRCKLSSDS